jgi:uncharacterized surface protein with fasciclin (FAS1) repeats
MIRRTRWSLALLATLPLTLAGTLVAPAANASTDHPKGTRSLATVLAADGQRFDRRSSDFDITDAAVGAVLGAKPDSAVKVLADGTTPLTAFLPTDRAFRRLAYSLTGRWYRSEARVFTRLANTLGVDTIESVLLYHVVPGATITYRTARHSDNVTLDTALEGASVTVDVRRRSDGHKIVKLVDLDPNAWNPRIVQANINRGNKQIAHGINFVLRPVDL